MILAELDDLLALRGVAQGSRLRARRPAMAHLTGSYRSGFRGRGLEFEEVRLYSAGDDARSIDWRVTARRGRPHTKLYREERERPVWLVADIHPGLFFGSRRQLKSTLLLRAAAVLAWTACLGGDRIGAVVGGGRDPQLLPPRSRDAGVLPVLQALVTAQPRATATLEGNGLSQLLTALQQVSQPGALVFVLSDFAGLDESTEPLLAGLAARHACWLLQLADPLEVEGLPAGRFRVGVPGRTRTLDGESERGHWQAVWAARESALSNLARRFNLQRSRLMTTDAVEETLPALLRESTWAV